MQMPPGTSRGEISISVRTLRRTILALVLTALAVVIGVLVWQQRDRLGAAGIFAPGIGDQIDRNSYQAVFLVGGQVYFGRLTTRGEDHFLLSDVYYLSQDAPPGDGALSGTLIKRGTELHAPREPMIIPAAQVLFIENLRDDSELVGAIRRFRSGEQTPAPARTAGPRPSPTATR